MNPHDESAVRCPDCGGPATDLRFSVDTGTRRVPVVIRACQDTTCNAFHPGPLQDI